MWAAVQNIHLYKATVQANAADLLVNQSASCWSKLLTWLQASTKLGEVMV